MIRLYTTTPQPNIARFVLASVAPIISPFNSLEFDWSSSPTPQQVYLFPYKCIFGGEVWGGLRLATAWCPENFLKRMSKEGESSQEFKMYNILIFNKNSTSLFWKIQCTDMWYICEFRHSFILVDKAPRLSISIDIWILSPDTLFVSSTNSIQIVRRQCCLVLGCI